MYPESSEVKSSGNNSAVNYSLPVKNAGTKLLSFVKCSFKTCMCDRIYENHVNNLRQITHMYFDFTTP